MMACAYCNSPIHVWWDCTKKPPGWKPAPAKSGGSSAVEQVPSKHQAEGSTPSPRSKSAAKAVKKSTAAPVHQTAKRVPKAALPVAGVAPPATAPAVDTPKRGPGRPQTITDMRAYKAEKERQRRARIRAEKAAKEQK